MDFRPTYSQGTKILAIFAAGGWSAFFLFLVYFSQSGNTSINTKNRLPIQKLEKRKVSWRGLKLLQTHDKANPQPVALRRTLASLETSSAIRVPISEAPNSNVIQAELPVAKVDSQSQSELTFEGLYWRVLSNEELYLDGKRASNAGVGIAFSRYYSNSGFGIRGKFGVMNDVEARYLFRSYGLIPRAETMIFAGGEVYRNSKALISGEYELAKVGLGLSFPFANRLKMQAEFSYGLGFEGSNKREVFFKGEYKLNPKWNLGLGYRFSLFEARSIRASGYNRLPFREGTTEYSTSLGYLF